MCNMPRRRWGKGKMDYPQTLLLKDEVEIVTVEDTEEGHEGRIISLEGLEVDNHIRHIIAANEELVGEVSLG
jgi:hypothetical protein